MRICKYYDCTNEVTGNGKTEYCCPDCRKKQNRYNVKLRSAGINKENVTQDNVVVFLKTCGRLRTGQQVLDYVVDKTNMSKRLMKEFATTETQFERMIGIIENHDFFKKERGL